MSAWTSACVTQNAGSITVTLFPFDGGMASSCHHFIPFAIHRFCTLSVAGLLRGVTRHDRVTRGVLGGGGGDSVADMARVRRVKCDQLCDAINNIAPYVQAVRYEAVR